MALNLEKEAEAHNQIRGGQKVFLSWRRAEPTSIQEGTDTEVDQ